MGGSGSIQKVAMIIALLGDSIGERLDTLRELPEPPKHSPNTGV